MRQLPFRPLLAALLLMLPAGAQNGLPEAGEDETITVPGYPVGEFREPRQRVLKTVEGQEILLLTRLDDPRQTLEVPVAALRLVQPMAKQTKVGVCCGKTARRVGAGRPRNRLFYRNPRIACAAYTAYILRHCGRPGGSFSASAQYAQLRKRGAKLVATKMSTRYTPYFRYLRAGDFLFFHKRGGRIGHEEIYGGNGLTSGTSSSEGRVGIRRIGNRGFAVVTVLRV